MNCVQIVKYFVLLSPPLDAVVKGRFFYRIFGELDPTLDQIRSNFLGSLHNGIGNNSNIWHVL